ncbi:peptidase domain-containing ABC transporter [Marinilactibacillus sp. Marseille-P9653]|uniref:peptidase domain-containing ABC transporter n=1 Tax=Marinilactibacillus sp. Marseille-P9653 TaxID=2866583 RepID=UPI001CE426A4|nr:peptidase domain-containing ABC transporter [Marinilactibacillus sp. Marseille-P9653]
MNKKVKYVEQNEHSECGLSCVVMLLNYHGIRSDLINLREKFGVPLGGNNFNELATIFKEYGLKSKAIKVNVGNITDDMLPCVAYWENSHFIVIEKVSKRNVTIVDPNIGRETLSYKSFQSKYRSVILYIESLETTEEIQINNKSFLKKFILNQIVENKTKYITIILLSFFVQGLTLIFSLMIRSLIDNSVLLRNQNILIFFVVSLIMYFFVQVYRNTSIERLKKEFNTNLNKEYIDKITKLPLSFFVNRSSGELVYRYNLISYIQQMLDTHLLKTSIDIVFSVVYISIMIYLSIELTFLILSISLIVIIVTSINNRYIMSLNYKIMSAQSSAQSSFLELLNGIETIKAIGIEDNFYRDWKYHFDEHQEISLKSNIVTSWLSNIVQTIQFSIPFLIIIFGSYLRSNYDLSWGTIISFTTLATTFVNPISEVATTVGQTLVVNSYMKKIDEVLIQKSHNYSNDLGEKIDKVNDLSLSKVKFSYSYFEKNIIEDICLSVSENEKVALVGPSGAGKSTLLKILAGLYSSKSGDFKVNGMDFSNVNYSDYNKKVGYVPQKTTIFNMTILENLILKELDTDLSYLKKVIKDTTLDELIDSLPQKEYTKISEDGMNLSGGQKQKIAITRSLIQMPDLLLLDEATSSLDNISEEKIISSLKNYPIGMVFISHSLDTIKHFDKIIVMNQGKIVGYGTHEKLIEQNELYKSLYKNTEV